MNCCSNKSLSLEAMDSDGCLDSVTTQLATLELSSDPREGYNATGLTLKEDDITLPLEHAASCLDGDVVAAVNEMVQFAEVVAETGSASTEDIANISESNLLASHGFLKSPAHRSYGTGLIYDILMASYKCEWGEHPERPERILRIWEKLTEERLLDRCVLLKPRLATEEEILAHHSVDHVNFLKSLAQKTDTELNRLSGSYSSVYLNNNTFQCASLAAGCAVELVDAMLSGKILNGAAVIRPPGHHAVTNACMGFCHINNVPLAATMAKRKYGVKRILILDWDIHYGNGTHRMFETDPSVLYFSVHRWDHGTFWPGRECGGDYSEVGVGPGAGFNMHVCWNKKKMGDGDYLAVFNQLLMPVAYEFAPELVIVSAGFDSGLGDPLGECAVTPEGYAQMTNMLKGLAGGKVAIVLEGGYNLATISNSMAACVSCLLGDAVPQLPPCTASVSALESIACTANVHKKFWKCLQGAGAEQQLMPDQDDSKMSTPQSGDSSRHGRYPRSNTRNSSSSSGNRRGVATRSAKRASGSSSPSTESATKPVHVMTTDQSQVLAECGTLVLTPSTDS